MKRKASETASKYKKRLMKAIDDLFKDVVRYEARGICYTCGVQRDWRACHAGHFIHNKLDFDPMNRRCQCPECNTGKGGNLKIFEAKLVAEYGQDAMDELRRRANQIWKPETLELEHLLEHWEQQYMQMGVH